MKIDIKEKKILSLTSCIELEYGGIVFLLLSVVELLGFCLDHDKMVENKISYLHLCYVVLKFCARLGWEV